jgi:hypothetical protein
MKKLMFVLIFVISILSILSFIFAFNWATEFASSIHKGWNLVYGFASPDQLDGQGFDKSHIKAIYAFNPDSQEYVRMYPNREDSKINIDDDILLQTAFWVYSDKTVEGSFNNRPSTTEYWLYINPMPYNDRLLYKGWNFFGVTPDIVGKNMDDIKGNCVIEKIYNWDAESQQWSNGLVGATVGSGVLIKVTNNCKFVDPIESDTSPPPSIPN